MTARYARYKLRVRLLCFMFDMFHVLDKLSNFKETVLADTVAIYRGMSISRGIEWLYIIVGRLLMPHISIL